MQREHEEAMRADFDRYVDIADQIDKQMNLPGPFTEEQFLTLNVQQDVLRDRWRTGPHAEHWNYLEDAHDDWRQTPDTMSRFYDNVAHNNGGCLTDMQLRSLNQAAEVTARSNERHAEVLREAQSLRAEKIARARRGRSTVERGR